MHTLPSISHTMMSLPPGLLKGGLSTNGVARKEIRLSCPLQGRLVHGVDTFIDLHDGRTNSTFSTPSMRLVYVQEHCPESQISTGDKKMLMTWTASDPFLQPQSEAHEGVVPSEVTLDLPATSFSSALLQSAPPPRQKQESEHRDDYYVNVGYAIRTLREELPTLFYRKLTFDIYRNDITFRDPLNRFSGIRSYKLIFWALRFHGRMFFRALWVEIGRIWQPNDRVIMVRWSVRGIPRVPWDAQGQFDGTSEYKLDKNGKIYEHKVDNLVMSNMQQALNQPLTVMELLRLAGAGVRTTPTMTIVAKAVVMDWLTSPSLLEENLLWLRFYWWMSGSIALESALLLRQGS
eukprot:TRINITY_DN2645_c0_g2_i2.p1 TRINITY_DN2645_c0_g2~~TRINITY_DN2645_c0_g2_i2.p1  ORF type:complete len:348 (-),score=60.01 TRINITY_DN2645_c0_g2_i2:271-1314(-)